MKIGTLYYKPWSSILPHFYVEETTSWIIFPHERYEFMAEQLKNKKMNADQARNFYIEEIGIPKNSVEQFLRIVKLS